MPPPSFALAGRLPPLALAMLACACAPTEPASLPTVDDFANVLALTGAPDSARDLSSHAFSDRGAWHMFGLPDPVSDSLPGAFPGPFLLAEGGIWLSRAAVGVELRVGGEAVRLDWDPAASHPAAHLPGRLRQELTAPGVALELELVFASPSSTLIRARLENLRAEAVEAEVVWTGGAFFLPVRLEAREGEVRLELEGRGTRVRFRAGEVHEEPEPTLETAEESYRIRMPSSRIPPGEAAERYLLVTVEGGPGADPFGAPPTTDGDARFLDDSQAVFRENDARWSEWVARVLEAHAASVPGGGYSASSTPEVGASVAPSPSQRLAVKAVQTLISNWRSARGGLRHDGLFPSWAYRGFHGVWSWDSWKHARALALFAPELAKDQLRVMVDHQAPDGMIPDVIYVDSAENNWRDTKPPLAAWAAHGIFVATGDTSFVGEVYPALLAYHRWWYLKRDHDGNGLCEYGSTDGTLIAAAWESGMDNAVRFDDARMLANGPGAWSMDRESVDLNAYLFAEKGYLAELALALGRGPEAEALREEAERLGELLRSSHFDDQTGYFHDVRLGNGEPVRVLGSEGWIPLWAGAATQEQADRVAEMMTDTARFAGFVPFPTLAMDHPAFDPLEGYWRGPVWLDQAYFAVRGLERYGHPVEARELGARLLTSPRGLLEDEPIFENYHPRTGEGLNAPHFSWSAAHLLLLLAEDGHDSGDSLP